MNWVMTRLVTGPVYMTTLLGENEEISLRFSLQTRQLSRIARVTPAFIRILMLTRRLCPIIRIQKLFFAKAAALYSGAQQ